MLRAFKWVALTLMGMLGTFYLVYAVYCVSFDVQPNNLFAYFKQVIQSNALPHLEIPNIPMIPIWITSSAEVGEWDLLRGISVVANFFVSFINAGSTLFNVLVSIFNTIIGLIRFVILAVMTWFGGIAPVS